MTKFHTFATASMPERIQVTQDLERRFKEQEAARQSAEPSVQQPTKLEQAVEGQR